MSKLPDQEVTTLEFAREYLARATHPGTRVAIESCIVEISRLQAKVAAMEKALTLVRCESECWHGHFAETTKMAVAMAMRKKEKE
jgi:hypothetical protein